MTCDIRLGRILGLPCICGERVVGHVEKAIPDEAGQQVAGFVIRRGLGSAKWVSREDVTVLGDVSVILGIRPGRMPKGIDAVFGTVKDESGLTLGRVTDWWISREGMGITGLEVTLGVMEDLLQGRQQVRRWTVRPGEDGLTVFLPREEWQNPPPNNDGKMG